MKTLKLISSLVILSIFFQSCQKGGPWGIMGKGDNITETKDIGEFDRVHLSIDADVFYTQDSVYKVEVSAQSNILAVLSTEVKSGVLTFDFKRNVWDHEKIKITVHSPRINEINISGSGNVTTQNAITTNDLELSISGSGSVYIASLNAVSLKADISGSGDVTIYSGSLISQNLSLSGFGKIDAENIMAKICTADISGSGDITVNVSDNLNATISGSGNISYKGNPTLEVDISGSGKLVKIN
ncbi:head GIN domain-containing protein [Aurantibacillus circumpalustris]|uniref:head GIN domain-containing protein n=1 Tax=Aurantibacillus circumpalustris TaxID=3036359 RepID=UPI00295C34D5|nr:head GIN domain-containing protein [Aurantibacillus circumpalustris]